MWYITMAFVVMFGVIALPVLLGWAIAAVTVIKHWRPRQ